ncbi:hypothetical protein GSI_10770 [Ganoderma sinense ZZ0214-1]|uniref:Uncharacterized protein n=1 Tax=Ganoderma sinense ZZ0214-1 TaxID=1077348 RepID=A0A2G8S228_9APHY|nr:hypothetical protein GSI_10770 [Ganoderma sinense ZZ0214-1]
MMGVCFWKGCLRLGSSLVTGHHQLRPAFTTILAPIIPAASAMSESRYTRPFKDLLSLQDHEVDEDLAIALTSLITTAVHDDGPKHTLNSIVKAVQESGCTSFLEPLTIIPIVVSITKDGADELIDLMSAECSAKEVVMAVEEVIETLDRTLQTGDDDEEDGSQSQRLGPARQLARLLGPYSVAIPRLPKWKKSPEEVLASRLSELSSVTILAGRTATSDESRDLAIALAQFVLALSSEATERAKALLLSLLEDTTESLINMINTNLARQAFVAHFSRLVIPRQESPAGSGLQDVFTSTWSALRTLNVTPRLCESRPSLASLAFLAHEPSYTFSVSTLTAFYPIILSSIQSNVAFDEVLSILISSLAPLRSAVPRPELTADLSVPLVHLLPYVASNHPDPDLRHYALRVISLVLGLSPSALRFHFLQELLSDEELPPQMRVATIGLLKEAVLEGLSTSDKNPFASPQLLATFGPLVLRPDPLDLFDSVPLNDFLESPEALWLVECLGFFYVLLLRDAQNQTGVRDADSLDNAQTTLLQPLRNGLTKWKKAVVQELDSDADQEHDHDAVMQLDILNMWLERVQDAIGGIPL